MSRLERVSATEKDGSRRISVDLPIQLIERFDNLKKQWGLRRRGDVVQRLLEQVLFDEKELDQSSEIQQSLVSDKFDEVSGDYSNEYNEDNAIVLIGNGRIDQEFTDNNNNSENKSNTKENIVSSLEIDLPGFVSKRANKLRASLGHTKKKITTDPILHNVKEEDVKNCLNVTIDHWLSLYGNQPKENVIEAAMIWLARDIWPNLEGTEDRPFTWTAATLLMSKLCPSWHKSSPSFDRIIVLAGVLEDPFATHSLKNRIPTLIRRFVNSFKRRANVTSFQTLESTMTIHGALKLLDLPTTAGASHSLSTIREAYKTKAIANHPDSGGSTELMRKINEAYQLLKELYRKK